MSFHLTDDFKSDASEWESAGVVLPRYDVADLKARTLEHPYWVHFGAGNLFREVHALVAQDLLNQGEVESGVVVAETFDADIIDDAFKPFDDRGLSVILKSDGAIETELVASVGASFGIRAHDEEWDGLTKVFVNPELQFVTVTITEKGYAVTNAAGEPLPWIKPEIEGGPDVAVSAMGAMAALLLARFNAGGAPIAMVSTDNFSQNGDRFGAAVRAMAAYWKEGGFVGQDFIDWLSDSAKVSFPLSMIDRITPNPAESVSRMLADKGFEDHEIFHTAKGTNVAPFANSEETWYLVIEDAFPNGRPALDKAGVYLGDRDTVNKADEMKVTTCLNPLHTALATFGMLCGFDSMSRTIAEPALHALVERLGYDEGLPVVVDPGIFSPREFLRQVIEVRVPNPNIPDTPARISTDTSQKIPVRYGVTISKYLASEELDLASLTAIPLVIAGWLRLLLGADGQGVRDDGTAVALSPDPRMADLQAKLAGLEVGGDMTDAPEKLREILADASIFGTDLNATPLADEVIGYFLSFASGSGSVIPTITRALAA